MSQYLVELISAPTVPGTTSATVPVSVSPTDPTATATASTTPEAAQPETEITDPLLITILAIATAVIALIAAVLGPLMLRKSAKETIRVADAAVAQTKRTADAANKSAEGVSFAAASSAHSAEAAHKNAEAAKESALSARAASLELNQWRQREETMRMLRWAADHAIKTDSLAESELGQVALEALGASELLQDADVIFVNTVIDSLVAAPADEYDEGDEFEVVEGLVTD